MLWLSKYKKNTQAWNVTKSGSKCCFSCEEHLPKVSGPPNLLLHQHASWHQLIFKVIYMIHLLYPFPSTRPIPIFQIHSFEDFEPPFGEQIFDLSPPNWHHSSTHLTPFISLEPNIFGWFGVPESISFVVFLFHINIFWPQQEIGSAQNFG